MHNQSKHSILICLPFMIIGGAERLLSQLTRYLVDQDWRVTIVTTEFSCESSGSSIKWFNEYTPEVYELAKFLEQSEYQQFIDYLIQSRQVDCMLLAGSPEMYKLLPYLSGQYPHIAIVDLLFNIVGHVDSHLLYKECITSVLAENNEVIDWLKDIGWDGSRINKVESGIDLSVYTPNKKSIELITKLGIKEDEVIIGFSGRLSPEKAPQLFVEIAKRCLGIKKLRFFMTGDGPMRDEIIALVENLPNNICFDYLGIVDDIAPYHSMFDILIIPSLIDGRPLAALEALASGTAVIASEIGALPELIVNDFNGYLCKPGEIDDFVGRISHLANSKFLLNKIKMNARSFAERNLNCDQMSSNYKKYLEDAISFKRIN